MHRKHTNIKWKWTCTTFRGQETKRSKYTHTNNKRRKRYIYTVNGCIRVNTFCGWIMFSWLSMSFIETAIYWYYIIHDLILDKRVHTFDWAACFACFTSWSLFNVNFCFLLTIPIFRSDLGWNCSQLPHAGTMVRDYNTLDRARWIEEERKEWNGEEATVEHREAQIWTEKAQIWAIASNNILDYEWLPPSHKNDNRHYIFELIGWGLYFTHRFDW